MGNYKGHQSNPIFSTTTTNSRKSICIDSTKCQGFELRGGRYAILIETYNPCIIWSRCHHCFISSALIINWINLLNL